METQNDYLLAKAVTSGITVSNQLIGDTHVGSNPAQVQMTKIAKPVREQLDETQLTSKMLQPPVLDLARAMDVVKVFKDRMHEMRTNDDKFAFL